MVAISFLSMGCNNEEPLDMVEGIEFDYSGEIVGLDFAFCPCCGGYIATITDDESEFRIQQVPDDFQSILDTVVFPVNVNLNYTELDPCGSYRFINVDEIEIVE